MFRFIIFIAMFLAGSAIAQTNINLGGMAVDTSAAIEVTAESLSIDQQGGTAVFEGDVVIGQGDLRISATRVEVIYGTDTNEIARLIATGNVTFVTAQDAAEAETADYDVVSGMLTLTGDVLLTQGASAISAQSMVVNVTNGTATMQGRVRTVLQQGGN
ncbi:lipopolysaccharide transport periplasmic protein LptA [Yoonia sp.]|uniref:lipopolysaccharide transport periplasmic protein LptA n=1 Tax=Yoonia sp. TaxID=2212373 RepID=UPI00391B79A2